MQTRDCTVTFKCEGCGVRKPEAERYRPRSAFTVCSQACLDTAQLSSRLKPLLPLQALIALEAASPSCGPAATRALPAAGVGRCGQRPGQACARAGRPQARASRSRVAGGGRTRAGGIA